MAQATSFSTTGTQHQAHVSLSDSIFSVTPSHQLVANAYRMYLANGRSAGASTLKRGQVSGGGKKPWRQKGTGRARVGSIRVPNWRGGGVVFGPTGNQNYEISMPIKMKRAAIRHALSLKATANTIHVVDDFDASSGRVKPTLELLANMKLTGKLLLVVPVKDSMVQRCTRNIAGLKVVSSTYMNVFDVMNADAIIIAKPALTQIEQWLGVAQ